MKKKRSAAAAKQRQRAKDRQHWLISLEYWARRFTLKESSAASEVAMRYALPLSRVRDIASANRKEVEDFAAQRADAALNNGTAEHDALKLGLSRDEAARRIGWEDVLLYCTIPTVTAPTKKAAPSGKS